MHFTIRLRRSKPFLYLLILTLCACTHSARYTSKDLSALPCEEHANDFFFPLEFDEDGKYVYPDQPRSIALALQEIKQVYVFVHGWNKVPMSAETDYQDLICRFYTHSKRGTNQAKAMVIGIFWPSTDFPPFLDFWTVKQRADRLAITGFQTMLDLLEAGSAKSKQPYNIALIGHSFGGRLLLNGLTHYLSTSNLRKYMFLAKLNQLQLILLNAASTEDPLTPGPSISQQFDKYDKEWDAKAFLERMKTHYGRGFTTDELLVDAQHVSLFWSPTVVDLGAITDLRIYNVFSSQDGANRFLYPIGAVAEYGGLHCAIGACGVDHWYHTVEVNANGSLAIVPSLDKSNVWNIDASKVIFSHTDIYKGRVANLIWELMATPRLPNSEEPSPMNWDSPRAFTYLGVLAQENEYSMRNINKLRWLGNTAQNVAREFSRVGFKVQDELRHDNWKVAETGIRRMLELNYADPGWQIEAFYGFIKKRLGSVDIYLSHK